MLWLKIISPYSDTWRISRRNNIYYTLIRMVFNDKFEIYSYNKHWNTIYLAYTRIETQNVTLL